MMLVIFIQFESHLNSSSQERLQRLIFRVIQHFVFDLQNVLWSTGAVCNILNSSGFYNPTEKGSY